MKWAYSHQNAWCNWLKSDALNLDCIERILREGVQRGDGKIEHPRMCVLAFLGMYNWTFQWYNKEGQMKPHEIADTFFQPFLDGIKRRDH